MAAGTGAIALIIAGAGAAYYYFKGKKEEKKIDAANVEELSTFDLDRLEHKMMQRNPRIESIAIATVEADPGPSLLIYETMKTGFPRAYQMVFLKDGYVNSGAPGDRIPFEDWVAENYSV